MRVPFKWLKEYVDIDVTPEELAEKLLHSGFETEEIIPLDKGLRGVVAAKILKVEKHENAERLRVCTVDAGAGAPVTICTAATNVFAGACVPAATDGAVLADGTVIRATNMRGVESRGMLCSGAELGIDNAVCDGAETDGIMLLAGEYAPGADMRGILGVDDCALNIAVTANRPDCRGVYGIAREVAAVLGKPLKPLELLNGFGVVKGIEIGAEVIDPDLCPRYILGAADGFKIERSPEWLRRRLVAVGMRPSNNAVDITNYVLAETGQPMHAFDAAKIAGGKLTVRGAEDGEKVTALDGKNYTLRRGMPVVADGKGVLAIAGVMGGEHSGITDETRAVIFEAARFNRGAVRAASRALNLRSESSARFSAGVDPASPETGIGRAFAILRKISPSVSFGVARDIGEKAAARKLIYQLKSVNKRLGVKVPEAEAERILNSLDIKTTATGGTFASVIPPHRTDIEDDADIAEEIIRIYGYAKVKPRLMAKARSTVGGDNFAGRCLSRAKDRLFGLGFNEISTYSFIPASSDGKLLLSEDSPRASRVKLRNPQGEEYGVMRGNLVHNLLTAAEYNLKRKNSSFRLFETGRAYSPAGDEVREIRKISALVVGAGESFFTLKEACEELAAAFKRDFTYAGGGPAFLHPGRGAYIRADGEEIGFIGAPHPRVARNYDIPDENIFAAEINFDALIEKYDGAVTAAPPPKFPAVERDVALVLPAGAEIGTIARRLRGASPLIRDVSPFDVYSGGQIEAGSVSAAFRLTLRREDGTLDEAAINSAVAAVLAAAEKAFGAKLRS